MGEMRSYDLTEVVRRQVESDELDYKSAMSWQQMSRQEKGKIVRHLTAFANTRGGFLVIGVSENASGVPDLATGVTEEQAGSFDPTPVGDFINAHIEPPLDFTIERPVVDGRRYVIFVVRPFKHLPHVCSRGVEGELQEGVFYIRTPEASSRPARRAHELQELLRRCMRNEREQLGRILRGILYETRVTGGAENTRSNDQVRDAEAYFRKRRSRNYPGFVFKFSIVPEAGLTVPLTGICEKLQDALLPCSNPLFLNRNEIASATGISGGLRYLSPDQPLMWQLFDNGVFCFFRTLPSGLSLEDLARFCAEVTFFAGNFGESCNWSEELLTLQLGIDSGKDAAINGTYRSASPESSAEIKRSVADLNSGRENHAARLFRRLGEEFQLPDEQLEKLEAGIRSFLERR